MYTSKRFFHLSTFVCVFLLGRPVVSTQNENPMKKITYFLISLLGPIMPAAFADANAAPPGTLIWSADGYLNPDCPDVSNVAVSAISSGGATISWTAGSDETAWQYIYTAQADALPDTLLPNDVTGTPSVTLSGLVENTVYYVWIRSGCGANGYGEWIGKSFRTACLPGGAFSENFDTPDSETVPDCWSTLVISSSPVPSVKYFSGVSFSPDYSIRFVHFFDPTAKTYLISPPSNEVGSGTYRVKFKMMSPTGGSSFVVGTMSDPSNPATFAVVDTFQATASWTDASVNLPSDGTHYFAILYQVSGNGFGYVDDVVFGPQPACADIASVTVSGITDQAASVNWTPGGNESSWQYVVSTNPGADPDSLDAISTGNPSVSLSALDADTPYTVWVRSDCSGMYGAWSAPTTFTTSCSPVITISENFDDTPLGELPHCWSRLNASGTDGAAVEIVNYDSSSAPNCVSLYSSGDFDGNQYLITPAVNNPGDAGYILKFKAKGANGSETLEIGTLPNTGSASGFTVIQSQVLSTAWTTYAFPMTGAPDPYIAFRHTGPFYDNIYIDDVTWQVAPTTAPDCATVVATTDACGNRPTLLTWAAVDGADGYLLSMGTDSGSNNILNGFSLGNTLSYSFSGDAGTTYYYTVTPYSIITGTAVDCEENTFTTATEGCLCPSHPSTVDHEGLVSVTLGDTTFPLEAGSTYSDQNDTVATLLLNVGNALSISCDTDIFQYFYYFYIDVNDDFLLTDDEIVYTTQPASGQTSIDASVLLPDWVTVGQHKARIITGYYLNFPNSCYNGERAETLDFTVEVTEPGCYPPAFGSAYVVPDCANAAFYVGVDVTDLGGGSPALSDGAATYPVNGTGIVQVGPFYSGSAVTLTLLHGGDAACNVPVGTFTYLCPPDCNATLAMQAGQLYGVHIPDGTGIWNVSNCAITTPGKEALFSFAPTVSGEYTFTVSNGTGGWIDYFYKEYGTGCDETGWICIDHTQDAGTYILPLTGGVNYLFVADSEGYTARSSDIRIDAPLSTPGHDMDDVALYPNPVSDYLKVSLSGKNAAVSVWNLLGQAVTSEKRITTDDAIDLRSLAPGTYLVRLRFSDASERILKILKK